MKADAVNLTNAVSAANVVKNWKDTVFRMIYRDKRELLSLYNALNGTDYTDEDELEVRTLDNAIFMNVKNDVSFVFGMNLNLYEHQSTVNPNMPLRNLFYAAHTLQEMTKDENLYGAVPVRIPTPRFVVFYNGRKKQPECSVSRLSDLFLNPTDEPEMELVVTVININKGNNQKLLDRCSSLREYMQYVDKVRTYSQTLQIDEAVNRAVDECIKEGILKEFLMKNKAEAIAVSIFEYNEEQHMESIRKEGFESGMNKMMIRNIHDLLEDYGEVPESLESKLEEVKDMEVLKKYHKIAARVNSVKEFLDKIKNI